MHEHYRKWECFVIITLRDGVWVRETFEHAPNVAHRFWTWKMANEWAWNNVDEPIYEIQTEVLTYDLETHQWR